MPGEAAAIRRGLDDCGGKVSEAAERLKMARVTLWRKMKKLNTLYFQFHLLTKIVK